LVDTPPVATKRKLEQAETCSTKSACYTVLVKRHADPLFRRSRLLWPTRWQLGFVFLLMLGMSCADPSYREPDAHLPIVVGEDASTPTMSKRDAQDDGPRDARVESAPDAQLAQLPDAVPTPDAQVASIPDAATPNDAMSMPLPHDDAGDAWWARLGKTYALRIRFFGRDRALGDAAGFKHEIIMLAQVSVGEQGHVAMQTQRCSDHGVVTGPGGRTDSFHWLFPEKLPIEHFELVLRDGKVQTEAAPRTIGYEAALPSGCKPGDKLPSRPDQAWLSGGTCRCGTEPLPTFANDCRVTDADGDKSPGFSVRHMGINEGVEGARAKDSSQIVDGVLSPDGRIRGSFIENYDFLGLTCGTSACIHNDILVCPLALNPVQFEPLPDTSAAGVAWDCPAILEQVEAGRFFTTEMFTFPQGC